MLIIFFVNIVRSGPNASCTRGRGRGDAATKEGQLQVVQQEHTPAKKKWAAHSACLLAVAFVTLNL